MPAPTTAVEFVELVKKSGVVDEPRLSAYIGQVCQKSDGVRPKQLAEWMVRDAVLTYFQAEQLLLGKWKRFTIGKYKVLERLGAGGMGQVFLCEHTLMRRRVALKVLPSAKAESPAALERFYREARAVAVLDHPNLVRAFDIDRDDSLHFLVMEYVDGLSLHEVVRKNGPLDPLRACHYVAQAADGLQYAYEVANLVHRDVKPGNILVDRSGLVKLLDLGLARFFNDEEDILTRKYDESTLGTADYLAPEQAVDSHSVDVRADIYSLGATLYYLLTGAPPFADGSVAQKLIWHQTRQPKAVRLVRPEVPDGIAAVLSKMMMKDPAARFQTPAEVAAALAPFTSTPVPPPTDDELPRLSPAAMAVPCNASGAVASGRYSAARGAASQRLAATTASSAMHTPLKSSPPAGPVAAPGHNGPPARPSGIRRAQGVRDDSNPFAPLLTASGTSPALDQSTQHVYATASARAASMRMAEARPPSLFKRHSIWALLITALLTAVIGLALWKLVFPAPI